MTLLVGIIFVIPTITDSIHMTIMTYSIQKIVDGGPSSHSASCINGAMYLDCLLWETEMYTESPYLGDK